jgi:hypothetical protein
MALSLYSPEAHAIVRSEPMHPIRVQNAITVADLRASMRQREETQRAGYAAALERCYSRVRRCASVGRTDCVFHVPHAVLGLPLFDVVKCAKHVVGHLKKNGFRVTFGDVDEFELRVSWDVGIEEESEMLGAAVESADNASASRRGRGAAGPRSDRWFDKSAVFAARRFDNQMVALPQAPAPPGPRRGSSVSAAAEEQQQPQFETPTAPRQNYGSAFGGMTQMSRAEQARHVEYLQQQTTRFASETPTPSPAPKVSPQHQNPARSVSPGGFMRSIAEFKPSGKFVLRV